MVVLYPQIIPFETKSQPLQKNSKNGLGLFTSTSIKMPVPKVLSRLIHIYHVLNSEQMLLEGKCLWTHFGEIVSWIFMLTSLCSHALTPRKCLFEICAVMLHLVKEVCHE